MIFTNQFLSEFVFIVDFERKWVLLFSIIRLYYLNIDFLLSFLVQESIILVQFQKLKSLLESWQFYLLNVGQIVIPTIASKPQR